MHADWDYEAGRPEYQSSEETRREYRQQRTPKLLGRKKKATKKVGCGANRRRNKHWSW